jgi:hypothetical protein
MGRCPFIVKNITLPSCPLFVLTALAWRFESIMVVVLFGVLKFVLAMVGVIARVVIKVKILTTF